jgi:hypothetical protein
MRVLMTAVLALGVVAFSATAFAGMQGKARVFADGNIVFANGISDVDLDALKARYGRTFLYMERGPRAWVVTDGDTLDRVRHILLPQAQLGQKQAALGLEQARAGMQQIAASEEKRRELEKKQNDLGRQQQELGSKQEALQRESDKRVDAILDQAIALRIAKQVR